MTQWKTLVRVACVAVALAGLTQSGKCEAGSSPAAVSTSDAHVSLTSGDEAPRVTELGAPNQPTWHNLADEPLPAFVEHAGKPIHLSWKHQPAQDTLSPDHVIYVYESAKPHLRLEWEWQARASFGPIEHTITLKNLGTEEYWLPLMDSLRLDWQVAEGTALSHFYVEKGANTPSAQGTHVGDLRNGYQWTGWSTTYAHPDPGRDREIIPYEAAFVTATVAKAGTRESSSAAAPGSR